MSEEVTWVVLMLTMAGVTVLTRCFFFLSQREIVWPEPVKRALRYAPVAALAAVVVPEVCLVQGQWPMDWRDARWFAVAVAGVWFIWQRGVFGTIVVGMAVFLSLRLGLGW